MSKLYTAKTKEELERVLGIMKPYIDECVCYDVVYSPKFGYLLIDLPGHDTMQKSFHWMTQLLYFISCLSISPTTSWRKMATVPTILRPLTLRNTHYASG
mgnify:CR=1 FL=1